MNIFDHLLNPPLNKMTMVRNIFTSYRKFLAVPLVNEVEWTSDKYSYIYIKGALDNFSLIPNFFFKKVEIFISLEVYTYVVTAC